MIGGVRPVQRVEPAAPPGLRRSRERLEAQLRALDEDRIDDLVRLLHDEEPTNGSDADDSDTSDGEAGGGDAATGPAPHPALARAMPDDVRRLAQALEDRIARARSETLAELRDLDDRMASHRFGTPPGGEGGARRGGTFHGYL